MRRAAALCAVLLIASAVPAFANIHTSALTGRVSVAGAPAAGVTVTASSPALIRSRTTITGSNGTYWLDHLPPGTYDVTFSRAGLTTLTRRAVLELARVARADAQLEETEDEESIVSTATDVAVGETQPLTTHFSDAAIDRLPVRRDPVSVARLAPTPVTGRETTIDGIRTFAGIATLYGQEGFEEIGVLRATIPVEVEVGGPDVVLPVATTRSGGERFSASFRDTMSSTSWNEYGPARGPAGGIEHFFELTAGGPLLQRRLRFFASGWRGEEENRRPRRTSGLLLKLTAAPGASHTVVGTYLTGRDRDERGFRSTQSILHYVGVASPRLIAAARLSRSTTDIGPRHSSTDDVLFAKSSWFLPTPAGDHLLTAGGHLTQFLASNFPRRNSESFFIDDRWTLRRWTVHLGMRYDSSHFSVGRLEAVSPRVSVTWDLSGNHRRALTASWGEYTASRSPGAAVREARLGFAAAVGTSGYVRADLARRTEQHARISLATLDAAYRLFDRFEAGANAAVRSGGGGLFDDRTAHVWLGGAFPFGSHEAGITLLQRYRRDIYDRYSTDIALRYRIPLSRVAFTTAADVTGLWSRNDAPRQIRIWIRAQL